MCVLYGETISVSTEGICESAHVCEENLCVSVWECVMVQRVRALGSATPPTMPELHCRQNLHLHFYFLPNPPPSFPV